jgi:hypothetical protein
VTRGAPVRLERRAGHALFQLPPDTCRECHESFFSQQPLQPAFRFSRHTLRLDFLGFGGKSGARGHHLCQRGFQPGPDGRLRRLGYDTVSTWNKPCQDVAEQDFGYPRPLNVIGRSISVLPYSPTHHVYLIRTQAGCVSINKEMLYP